MSKWQRRGPITDEGGSGYYWWVKSDKPHNLIFWEWQAGDPRTTGDKRCTFGHGWWQTTEGKRYTVKEAQEIWDNRFIADEVGCPHPFSCSMANGCIGSGCWLKAH